MTVKNYDKLDGTTVNKFQLEAAANGAQLKNTSGAVGVDVRNGADSAFGNVAVAEVKLTGSTYVTSLKSSASQSASYTITMPTTAGSPNQILSTDGSGVTSWVNAASGATDVTDTTSFAFGSGSTVTMFTLPANSVIECITVVVDTAFDTAASASIGVSGNASKYMGAGDMNLQVAAGWSVYPNILPVGTTEALEIAYSAAGATAGAARVIVNYSNPI